MRKFTHIPAIAAAALWTALRHAAVSEPAHMKRSPAHNRRGARLWRAGGPLTLAAFALFAAVSVTAGCSSNSATSPPAGASHSPTTAPSASSAAAGLVGRWERVTTCQELVGELDKAGLGPLAPYAWSGQTSSTGLSSFAPGNPKPTQAHPCTGALSREHSHFFSQSGQFGSLDWAGRTGRQWPLSRHQQQHPLHRQPPHRSDIPLPHPARRHAPADARAYHGHASPSACASGQVQRGVLGHVGRLRRLHMEACPVPKLVLGLPAVTTGCGRQPCRDAAVSNW